VAKDERLLELPHCSRCRHYWITHDPAHPHGCHAFALKSPRLPMLDVRAASGRDCAAFERKELREGAR
jgi:hypothetical protein